MPWLPLNPSWTDTEGLAELSELKEREEADRFCFRLWIRQVMRTTDRRSRRVAQTPMLMVTMMGTVWLLVSVSPSTSGELLPTSVTAVTMDEYSDSPMSFMDWMENMYLVDDLRPVTVKLVALMESMKMTRPWE